MRRIRTNVVRKLKALGTSEADETLRARYEAAIEDMEELQSCMEACKDAVDVGTEQMAYSFLGVNANYGVVSSLGSVAVTFFSYIWAMYLKTNNENSLMTSAP